VRPVNLLPARYRRARPTGERSGVGYAAIGVLAVLLLMVLLYVLTSNGIDDAKNKTAKAQAEQQAAQARAGQLQGYGDFAALKASREQAVTGVALARFDYERLMREIALVLPHDTYLTSFTAGPGGGTATTGTATATGPSITIVGCAPNHQGVATAVVRLRKLHSIVDVNLQGSQQAQQTTAGAAVTCKDQFSAVLTMQAESAPTVSAPVPARLGGGQ
jgi:Tfp pilus assembly protein PilN